MISGVVVIGAVEFVGGAAAGFGVRSVVGLAVGVAAILCGVIEGMI